MAVTVPMVETAAATVPTAATVLTVAMAARTAQTATRTGTASATAKTCARVMTDATGDTDGDGVCDDTDVCTGDDATGDTDTDGVCDDLDVCLGDDATGDTDTDGVCDDVDICAGDDATGDSDADGVCDDSDVCDGDDAVGDTDGDLLCDDVDPDDDEDGCADGDDANPLVFSEDEDGDGSAQDCDPCFGNDAFGDADGDGICDIPFDSDGDGCVDLIDTAPSTAGTDSDGDGVADECDFCPSDATSACAAWGVSKDDAIITYYNTDTYTATYEAPIADSSGTYTIEGTNALARDPLTGTFYGAVKDSSNRYLGTVDMSSGDITVIGAFTESVSSLAFDAAGTLYAGTGSSGSNPESLFTVDLASAALTLVTPMGNGTDGDVVAYCPDDGLMYHLSGSGTQVFESIDLGTGAITAIGGSYSSYEVLSFSWDPAISAFQVNFREGFAMTIDTAGTATDMGLWSDGGLTVDTGYDFRGQTVVQ